MSIQLENVFVSWINAEMICVILLCFLSFGFSQNAMNTTITFWKDPTPGEPYYGQYYDNSLQQWQQFTPAFTGSPPRILSIFTTPSLPQNWILIGAGIPEQSTGFINYDWSTQKVSSTNFGVTGTIASAVEFGDDAIMIAGQLGYDSFQRTSVLGTVALCNISQASCTPQIDFANFNGETFHPALYTCNGATILQIEDPKGPQHGAKIFVAPNITTGWSPLYTTTKLTRFACIKGQYYTSALINDIYGFCGISSAPGYVVFSLNSQLECKILKIISNETTVPEISEGTSDSVFMISQLAPHLQFPVNYWLVKSVHLWENGDPNNVTDITDESINTCSDPSFKLRVLNQWRVLTCSGTHHMYVGISGKSQGKLWTKFTLCPRTIHDRPEIINGQLWISCPRDASSLTLYNYENLENPIEILGIQGPVSLPKCMAAINGGIVVMTASPFGDYVFTQQPEGAWTYYDLTTSFACHGSFIFYPSMTGIVYNTILVFDGLSLVVLPHIYQETVIDVVTDGNYIVAVTRTSDSLQYFILQGLLWESVGIYPNTSGIVQLASHGVLYVVMTPNNQSPIFVAIDLKTEKERFSIQLPVSQEAINCIVEGPNGSFLLGGRFINDMGNSLVLQIESKDKWHLLFPEGIFKEGSVVDLVYLPDKDTLFAMTLQRTLAMTNLGTSVPSFTYTAAGKFIAAISFGSILLPVAVSSPSGFSGTVIIIIAVSGFLVLLFLFAWITFYVTRRRTEKIVEKNSIVVSRDYTRLSVNEPGGFLEGGKSPGKLISIDTYTRVTTKRHQNRGLYAAKYFDIPSGAAGDLVRKIALKEIKILKLLKHPNTVHLCDKSKGIKEIVIYTDLYDQSMADLFNSRKFSAEEVLPIAMGILKGLKYIHSLHRVDVVLAF
eukprot:TRINITY_DN5000_c0_g1_i1.p1 TRINITY_DN5000_c0_g1~~TRINITY_DN5000_c0_g1_i1.p1  ORF type:complete len:893 (-),score=236.22 TRINITY_DN5000_c0_g1_i1:624-3302(-)